ncbi:hypothetical protein LBMAG56_20020 [Verrucomicrobiota bacterium]|nr:hypothetical protein LBMAG56_20020 [Verrucomicrobiota bacterium]
MMKNDFEGRDGPRLGNLSQTPGCCMEISFRVAEIGIDDTTVQQAGAQGSGELKEWTIGVRAEFLVE